MSGGEKSLMLLFVVCKWRFSLKFSYHKQNVIIGSVFFTASQTISFTFRFHLIFRPLYRCVYNSIFVRERRIMRNTQYRWRVFFHYSRISFPYWRLWLALDLARSYCCLLLSIALKITAEKCGSFEMPKTANTSPVSDRFSIACCSLFIHNIVIGTEINCIANRIR